MGTLIKLGAIAGLSSVILVCCWTVRGFYSMARDGLLPPFVACTRASARMDNLDCYWRAVAIFPPSLACAMRRASVPSARCLRL